MKIGVFGGTFNPIHNSHVYLAERFMQDLELDLVFIIPTYIPPHKTADNLASSEHRYKMCELAFESNSKFKVSDFEIEKKGTSYTYETLEYFSEKYPEAEFYLMMGSDMFLTMEDWRNPEKIYQLATLCTIAREKDDDEYDKLYAYKKDLSKKGAKSIILRIEPKPLSSTEIRGRVREGLSLDGFVPKAVEQYIEAHGLYK